MPSIMQQIMVRNRATSTGLMNVTLLLKLTMAEMSFDARPVVAELDFDMICENADTEVHYQKPPKYPSTQRDIAMVVDADLEVGSIIDEIKSNDSSILEDVKLFDIYRGMPIPPDKKSCAFSLTYRSNEKTLTDEEVDEVQQKIINDIREKFDAVLREQ